jgi:hypothetical protein
MSRRDLAGRTPAPAPPISSHPVKLRRKCACGGAARAEGECEECQKKRLQRSALDTAQVRKVPASVHDVLRAPGKPLDRATRAAMEPHFGHDFGKVRVHADDAAAESADAVHAAAYTVGRDVVFAAGKYQPGTAAGQRLMAHELAHVIQQERQSVSASSHAALEIGSDHDPAEHEADRAAAGFIPATPSAPKPAARTSPATVRRVPWGKEYGTDAPSKEASAKASIGEIKATTKTDPLGTPAADEIGKGILERIYPFLKADLDKGKVKPETVERYRNYLNDAFHVMKIDTVEAQANFLAHASEESGQFRAFTESQGEAQHWEEDPKKVKLDPSKLPKDKDVNPKGNWEFIGRGAVQVTHEPKYVEVIAELEKMAEQYQKEAATDAKAAAMAKQAQAAADAIKADPSNAAKPEFAFIVSAAFMKRMEGDRKASQKTEDPWTGKDSRSGWVGGGEQAEGSAQADALVRKKGAFDRIFCVLLGEAKNAKKKIAPHKLKGCGL